MPPLDPCSKCGRTVLDLRRDSTRESFRGSAPLCEIPQCPLVAQIIGFNRPPPPSAGLELSGPSPPAVFVGRHGYPKVAIGPLLPPGAEYSAPMLAQEPCQWARELSIADILHARSRLVRSKTTVGVHQRAAIPHALDVSRDLAMASKPVDTEITLKKPPKLDLSNPTIDTFAAPMGPSVEVTDARVLTHPSVPRKVDAIVSDIHADATTGAHELYEGGISPYHIQRLLSVGLLGESSRRRLVPTRWSITATDDILGKQLIEQVKESPQLDAPQVYAADLFGNYFHVLLVGRVPFSFEMIEAWQNDDGTWAAGHDKEGYSGRTTYADSITGAYYAARLSVLEHLVERQRQAGIFVYREITEEYWAPLGVWVIREAVKQAMQGKGLVFEDIPSAIRHIERRSRWKDWVRVATLPRDAQAQKKLTDFE